MGVVLQNFVQPKEERSRTVELLKGKDSSMHVAFLWEEDKEA